MCIPIPGLEMALRRWWSRWVLRGRKERPETLIDGALALRYTARYRATTAAGFAAVTGFYVLVFLNGRIFKVATLRDIAMLTGSVLVWFLFAFHFVSSQLERVVITPTQLRRRSWRGGQEIVWGDVTFVRIDYRKAAVKIGQGGTVVDVSFFLDGLRALADALQQHQRLPPELLAVVPSDRAVPFP